METQTISRRVIFHKQRTPLASLSMKISNTHFLNDGESQI